MHSCTKHSGSDMVIWVRLFSGFSREFNRKTTKCFFFWGGPKNDMILGGILGGAKERLAHVPIGFYCLPKTDQKSHSRNELSHSHQPLGSGVATQTERVMATRLPNPKT